MNTIEYMHGTPTYKDGITKPSPDHLRVTFDSGVYYNLYNVDDLHDFANRFRHYEFVIESDLTLAGTTDPDLYQLIDKVLNQSQLAW